LCSYTKYKGCMVITGSLLLVCLTLILNPRVVDDRYRIGDITQNTTSSPLRVASVVQIKEVSKQV
jgi:hypothetical protein